MTRDYVKSSGLPSGLLIGQRVALGEASKQEVLELTCGQRRRIQMTLLANATERDQCIGLRAGLDAVGGDCEADLAHQRDDRAHDRTVVRVRGDGVDRHPIDAHLVERQTAQQAERRDAASEVVETHTATPRHETQPSVVAARQVSPSTAVSLMSIVTSDGSMPFTMSLNGSSRHVRSVASGPC